MNRRTAIGVFLILFVSAFSDADAQDRPNILWINAEDMSPHLGCYGHPDADTPHIDALARQGIVYENAFATAPICSPSRSCLATGLYATSLGTQHLRCEVEIPERVVPLARRLQAAGYFCTNTGKSDYNFSPDGIWDAWSNDIAPWKDREAGQPFFGFVTVGETHEGRINTREKYLEAVAGLDESRKHDPAAVSIPPFYPDSPEIRRIFAGMYDLATVFDDKVGRIVARLKQDGDLDNTILFIFGDHGNGLPRYKRSLTDSGLRVPLVVAVPPKYRGLCNVEFDAGGAARTERLVSFVDFPATALSLAGCEIPAILQGEPFLGRQTSAPREYVFGARSRADDMFEVSRSVFDGRYLYVRHFLPHIPYLQRSVIFGDQKDSVRELRRLYRAGQLNEHAAKLWAESKPREELYDLRTDPHELRNLAEAGEMAERKRELEARLRQWILESRDSGLLPESEYQIRAAESGETPFDVVQDPQRFDLNVTLDAAWKVGDRSHSVSDLVAGFSSTEPGVRYWTAVALECGRQFNWPGFDEENLDRHSGAIQKALRDPSPAVRTATAELIIGLTEGRSDGAGEAFRALTETLEDERPWVALEAAAAASRLDEKAAPLVPVMKRVVEKNRSAPGSRRPYKDFNYASFTGWALENALNQCGESEFVDAINK